ncbi:MAG: site-specific DNA-methyltransferase [Burkholderiales bacterium]|nr:site-specific DNA-methyltransferase [Burkholderiales bacterium]
MRPEVGTQPQFKKKKAPKTYRYDSSLSPALEWDGQNSAREQAEVLIAQIEAQVADLRALKTPSPLAGDLGAVPAKAGSWGEGEPEKYKKALSLIEENIRALKAIGKPFLNWAGKAERLSFDVPTLPLFIHERLSTQAILETLKGQKRDRQLDLLAELFADPKHSITDQILRAYEHRDQWVNRMVLGDSLVVMNSLLHYENLGGQVQMIYIDPPYGVKFGSNFQPFVRKRDVSPNDDDDMTREPEMVQAYRDTWELGLHSYLTYLRDRLLIARELLAGSGSVFVQISDENLHHVREVMDEVFGVENYVGQFMFRKTGGQSVTLVPSTYDFLLHYAKDVQRVKFRTLFTTKEAGEDGAKQYIWLESPDSRTTRKLSKAELDSPGLIPEGWRVFRPGPLTSPGASPKARNEVELQGRTFTPGGNRHWSLGANDTQVLDQRGRVMIIGNTPCSKLYLDDFPVSPLKNVWPDTGGSGFSEKPLYVVQTDALAIERCVLMTTDPGDLVLDPTCGSGTTAYIAEQWGRRWITIDTSRVPLALARQRLLTATFNWYELNDAARGPAGGFVYKRKQNRKGEEVGGIVPHVTLKSIANNEPPAEEVLVDRPETTSNVTRVSGPFTFEATIPTPIDWEGDGIEDSGIALDAHGPYVERMLEVLRKSPLLRLDGNRTVALRNVRPPVKSLSLSAEAIVGNSGETAPHPSPLPGGEGVSSEGTEKAVAFVFGPENGAVSEKLVFEAAREAYAKSYTHLYVIGFAIQANARTLIEKCAEVTGIAATYVQATPDLMMGDLLKNMRSSQIFSVCGLPEIAIHRGKDGALQVELVGLDVFDPVTMAVDHRKGDDVPAWFLDTDYNGLCFHVTQAFFPRTSAWDNLKRALKAEYEDAIWDHLAGTTSAPFSAGEHGQVAVKVIDDRGNELLVTKNLKD